MVKRDGDAVRRFCGVEGMEKCGVRIIGPRGGRATYVLWRDYTCQDSRTPRRRLGRHSTARRLSKQGPLSCFYCFNVTRMCLVDRESSGKVLALVILAGAWSQDPATSAACALLCEQKCQRLCFAHTILLAKQQGRADPALISVRNDVSNRKERRRLQLAG